MRKENYEVTSVTTKTRYISIDGQFFDNEESCKAWEESYKGTIWAGFFKLNPVEIDFAKNGIPYISSDDDEVLAVMPTTLDNIVTINNLWRMVNYITDKVPLTPDDVDKVFAINFGCSREFMDIFDYQKILDEVAKNGTELITKCKAASTEPAD